MSRERSDGQELLPASASTLRHLRVTIEAWRIKIGPGGPVGQRSQTRIQIQIRIKVKWKVGPGILIRIKWKDGSGSALKRCGLRIAHRAMRIRKETACKWLTCLPSRSNNSGRGRLGPGRSFILKQRKIKVELTGTRERRSRFPYPGSGSRPRNSQIVSWERKFYD